MLAPLVIAIVGPTASGKTQVAVDLAQAIWQQAPTTWGGVDFLSADSRQVYQGLEITTGADIPASSTRQTHASYPYPFYVQSLTSTFAIHWHGTSIIPPTAAWSVAHFRQLAHAVIRQAATQNRLVFIIGGTGLYHQAITDHNLTDMTIKPNLQLRAKAEEMSLEELQNWLQAIDFNTFTALNESDRQNPRRLIRHIEKSSHKHLQAETKTPLAVPPFRLFTLGTQCNSLEALTEKIHQRVKNRIDHGALQEVALLDQTTLDPQAQTTLGLREISGFLDSQYDLAALEQLWSLHERQYAKRQLTWWKKRPNIQWLSSNSLSEIDGLIKQILEMTGKA